MSNVHLRKIREASEVLQAASESLAALDAARQLREAADALELEMVRAARQDGHSWSRIGSIYGLTKQGAQQRFRAGIPTDGDSKPRAAAGVRRKARHRTDPGEDPPVE